MLCLHLGSPEGANLLLGRVACLSSRNALAHTCTRLLLDKILRKKHLFTEGGKESLNQPICLLEILC